MQMKLDWAALGLLVVMATVSGCDKMAGLSNSTQATVKREYNDAKTSWLDLFTYHPPVPAPMPQTRYCYQMQSDVVCYDSEQPALTAKLVGYQDGDRLSWIQPGGGSLGVSGGQPVAYRSTTSAQMDSQAVVSNDYNASTGPVSGSVGAGPSDSHINVNTLPPVQPRVK